MLMNFDMDSESSKVVNIKVIGAGGGGGNAINHMVDCGIQGVEFISINTDKQALMTSKATQKIQIGEKLTRGRGAGGDPGIGQRAGEESRDEIAAAIKGAQMVFITAGMGGGTGTGAAPIIAEIARDTGALTIGIVTKPFLFEGKHRMEQAESGILALREHVDSLIIIPNERLKSVSEQKITLMNAFMVADDVLRKGVQSISDIIDADAFINLDFADVCAIMRDSSICHMGIGHAKGEDKAEKATKEAISSPLLETSINGARRVIVNVTASKDIGLDEVDAATTLVHDAAHPDVNLIFGVTFDPSFEDEMSITVIATGFDDPETASAPSSMPDFVKFGFGQDAKEPEESLVDDDLLRLFNGNK